MKHFVKLAVLLTERSHSKYKACDTYYHGKYQRIQRISHSAGDAHSHSEEYCAYLLCRTRYRAESDKGKRSCHRNARTDRAVYHHNYYADYGRQYSKRHRKALCVCTSEHIHKRKQYSKHQRRACPYKKSSDRYIRSTCENSVNYRIKH